MFDHVISLGWFCGPAMEIRQMGLRDASYPFDWLLTHNFSVVIDLIKKKRYIKLYDTEMLQYEADASKWYNREYLISLFHDFDKYEKMSEQLSTVNEKYFRRMKRFYEKIKEPSLFLRYIKDEEEALYISKHETEIINILKGENEANEIVYIANKNLKAFLQLSESSIYFVVPDNQDYVSRSFLQQLPNFCDYLIKNVRRPQTKKTCERNKNAGACVLKLRKLMRKWSRPAKSRNEFHKEGILEKSLNEEIILFRDLEDCSGCGACAAICPRQAIEMSLIQDFFYPTIDKNKCIRCKSCLNICPFK